MENKSKFKWRHLALAAVCLVLISAITLAVWPQAATLSITLTGQPMIRSDARVHTPDLVSRTAPLLKGDVIFTNFEATVIENGQATRDGRVLSPPKALAAPKALVFNLRALSDNHLLDLKIPGIQ